MKFFILKSITELADLDNRLIETEQKEKNICMSKICDLTNAIS